MGGLYEDFDATAESTAPQGLAPPQLTEAPPDEEIDHTNAIHQMSDSVLLKAQHAGTSRRLQRDSLLETYNLAAEQDESEFEGHYGEDARSAGESFMTHDSDRGLVQGAPAEPESDDPWDAERIGREVMNTIFSDEMGLMGVKWNEEGVSWNYDNFQHQLVEHPYMTALTIGSYLVPTGFMWMKGARVALRAAQVAKSASGAVEMSAKVVKARGLFGAVGGDELAEMSIPQAMRALGPRVRFDDHAKLVKGLALSDEVSDGRKFFHAGSDGKSGLYGKIRDAASDEEIAKLVPEKELRKMLIGDAHAERFMQLKAAERDGKLGKAGAMELSLWRKFGNKYSESLVDGNRQMIENVDSWLKKEKIAEWIGLAPTGLSADATKAMYKYSIGHATREEVVELAGEEAAAYSQSLGVKAADMFKAQFDEGFNEQSTVDLFDRIQGGMHSDFGTYHVPAVLKDTPGYTDLSTTSKSFLKTKGKGEQLGGIVADSNVDMAKTMAPATLGKRGKYTDAKKILDDLDILETDPLKNTAGGFVRDNVVFQLHRTFRDVMTDAITNPAAAKARGWTASADDILALPKSAQKQWVNFEQMDDIMPGLGARMKRMVEKQLAKDGTPIPNSLPLIDRNIVEQFFGKGGSAKEAAGTFGKLFQLLTAVHKTSKTSLNAPSHITNTMGNMVFLAMAGMNPVSITALSDGKIFTRMFSKVAKQMNTKGNKMTWEEAMSKDNLKTMFKSDKDRYITTVHGDKIDLAEVLSDPHMHELMEAQAFDSTEGWGRAKSLYEELEKLSGDNFGESAVKGVAKLIHGVGELPGMRQTLQHASSAYLGEDMVPKMMYMANLLRKGWATEAIVKEVGRRLPQYKTLGSLPKKGRAVVLPWITFVSESARITKNNMMDSPVRMMAFMHAPAIAQSIATGSGVGLTQGEIYGDPSIHKGEGPSAPHDPNAENQGVAEGLPSWGNKSDSIFLKGEKANPIVGAYGGAATLGVIGGATFGAPGAAAGVALGGVGGWLLGNKANESYSQAEMATYSRSMALGFLPTSAVNAGTNAINTWAHLDPFSDTASPGSETMQAAVDISPVEPLSIGMDLLNILSGKDTFGREIKTPGNLDFMGKMAMGLLGFTAPPLVQKYGMRISTKGQGMFVPGTTDVEGMTDFADMFDANGGQMTLPREVTPTFLGIDASSIKSLDKNWGRAAGGAIGGGLAFAATKSPKIAAAAAGFGALAGGEINNRKLMNDLGILRDPYTDEYGEWTMDFFMNSILGVKSYKPSSASAQDAQARRHERHGEVVALRQQAYMDSARNGQRNKSWQHAEEVYKGMQNQYAGEPSEVAIGKYLEWMGRTVRALRTSPQGAAMSEEQISRKIAIMKQTVLPDMSAFQRQKLAELEANQFAKRAAKAPGLKFVFPQ
jgi:hypothetical protein